ncbi:DUF2568 domain-containing protein [Oceanobacillus salinisoli]|uniref:DUF2568 domain-containing protein n=1 Tax=Oceanobacillus salinisoli TaxID=2678611 RepID=UPI0012E2260D
MENGIGICTPFVVEVVWAIFIAPKAAIPVSVPLTNVLKISLFSLAALTLFLTDKKGLAAVFLVVAFINMALLHLFKLS